MAGKSLMFKGPPCRFIALQNTQKSIAASISENCVIYISQRSNISHCDIEYRYLKNGKVLLHYACLIIGSNNFLGKVITNPVNPT